MTTYNYQAINATRQHAQARAEIQRSSEIARMANELQKQGLTRTEALRLLDQVVPHPPVR